MGAGAGQVTALESFVALFRGEFRRRDQARWAEVYLRGLLEGEGRRTIEGLARSAGRAAGLGVEDVAQALQHFLSRSPWDEGAVWRRLHGLLAGRLGATGCFVLEEVAFVKQGRHSVGVQRQYSRALGRKANCQVAVLLAHVGVAGYTPLGCRLYLPRAWLQDVARLEAAGVPAELRRPQDKLALALALVDGARECGLIAEGLAIGTGWQDSEEFQRAAVERGLPVLALPEPALASAAEGRRQLQDERGLGHFEGRSWRGFHHHTCLAALAQVFHVHGPLAD